MDGAVSLDYVRNEKYCNAHAVRTAAMPCTRNAQPYRKRPAASRFTASTMLSRMYLTYACSTSGFTAKGAVALLPPLVVLPARIGKRDSQHSVSPPIILQYGMSGPGFTHPLDGQGQLRALPVDFALRPGLLRTAAVACADELAPADTGADDVNCGCDATYVSTQSFTEALQRTSVDTSAFASVTSANRHRRSGKTCSCQVQNGARE